MRCLRRLATPKADAFVYAWDSVVLCLPNAHRHRTAARTCVRAPQLLCQPWHRPSAGRGLRIRAATRYETTDSKRDDRRGGAAACLVRRIDLHDFKRLGARSVSRKNSVGEALSRRAPSTSSDGLISLPLTIIPTPRTRMAVAPLETAAKLPARPSLQSKLLFFCTRAQDCRSGRVVGVNHN